MAVNPNIARAQGGAPKELASGAPSRTVATSDTLLPASDVTTLRKALRGRSVQCHLRGSLNALDALVRSCFDEGPYRHFKHAINTRDTEANYAAMHLIRHQLCVLEGMMEEAKEEHEAFLRAELAAYELRTKERAG